MSVSPANPKKRLVLFHRDFQRFTGGHLKVWDYFNHVLASERFEPRISFTASSAWDPTNPWFESSNYVAEWRPETADVLFVAGKDWQSVPADVLKNSQRPIINLVQHPRHAEPHDELYGFLPHRAIRICVSQQVADAINATRQVNGPVFVIPNGIALDGIPHPPTERDRSTTVLLSGFKAPELAEQIDRRLRNQGISVRLLVKWISRSEYLKQLTLAKIVVTLPRPSEGFYLPAVEAMGCGGIVICPDCVGNRDFCHDAINCFRPAYHADEIIKAIQRALALSPQELQNMRKRADETVAEHSLDLERARFLKILHRIDEIWRDMD